MYRNKCYVSNTGVSEFGGHQCGLIIRMTGKNKQLKRNDGTVINHTKVGKSPSFLKKEVLKILIKCRILIEKCPCAAAVVSSSCNPTTNSTSRCHSPARNEFSSAVPLQSPPLQKGSLGYLMQGATPLNSTHYFFFFLNESKLAFVGNSQRLGMPQDYLDTLLPSLQSSSKVFLFFSASPPNIFSSLN